MILLQLVIAGVGPGILGGVLQAELRTALWTAGICWKPSFPLPPCSNFPALPLDLALGQAPKTPLYKEPSPLLGHVWEPSGEIPESIVGVCCRRKSLLQVMEMGVLRFKCPRRMSPPLPH